MIFNTRFEAVAYLKTRAIETPYCYMLLHNSIPFYVGISSSNKRLYSHEKEAKPYSRISNALKTRKIRKILRNNESIQYQIVREFTNVIEAYHAERSLILFYGKVIDRTGILTNLTDGGEGAACRPSSAKQKAAVSKANKGKPKTQVTLDRLSVSIKKYFETNPGTFKGKKHTEETKKLMSIRQSGENHPHFGTGGIDHFNYGRKHSDETKQKIIEAASKRDNSYTEDRKQHLRDYWAAQPLLVCPHCNKESRFLAAMTRCHFDRCKNKVTSGSL